MRIKQARRRLSSSMVLMSLLMALPAHAAQSQEAQKPKPRIKVAVLSFKTEGDITIPNAGDIAATLIAGCLDSQSFALVERERLIKILEEHDLTAAAIVDNPQLVAGQRLSGVDKLLLGTVSGVKGKLALTAYFVDLDGKIEKPATATTEEESLEALLVGLRQLVSILCESGPDRILRDAEALADRARFSEAITTLAIISEPRLQDRVKALKSQFEKRAADWKRQKDIFDDDVHSLNPKICERYQKLCAIAPNADELPTITEKKDTVVVRIMHSPIGDWEGQHTQAGPMIVHIKSVQGNEYFGDIELPKYAGGCAATFRAEIVSSFNDLALLQDFRHVDPKPEISKTKTYLVLRPIQPIRGEYHKFAMGGWNGPKAPIRYCLLLKNGTLSAAEFCNERPQPTATIECKKDNKVIQDCLPSAERIAEILGRK